VAGDFGWAVHTSITDQAVAASRALTGVTVRREKALAFSACNSTASSLRPIPARRELR
jgi:hypothetical protein